jgi:hypothetical protein
VHFTGHHGTNFETVGWSRDANNPQPCPLVVHLPDGDYSDKELSDPKLLVARGWVADQPVDGLRPLTYRRGNLVVQVAHRGGVLELVNINALTCPEPQEGIVSIGGKLLTLPVSDDEMVRLLGQPIRRR